MSERTPIADMVEKLLSTGIPPEAIVAAVRAAEQHAQGIVARDPIATKRRAYDRERKRRKSEEKSTGTTPQKERSPTPPKEKLFQQGSLDLATDEESKKEGVTRARGRPACRLPEPWPLSDEAGAFGLSILGTMARVENEHAKFCDHWHAANGPPSIKRNWLAAWRNWCRRAIEMNGAGNGQHRQTGNGSHDFGFAGISAQLRARGAGRSL